MLVTFRTMFSASGTYLRTVLTTSARTHYRTSFAQIASIAETTFVARALVATSAFVTVIIVTFATTLAAFGTKNRTVGAMSAQAQIRTIITQITGIAKTFFKTRAIVAYSAVKAYRIATLRTILPALMAY